MTRRVAIDGGQSAVRVRASWHSQELRGPGYAHRSDRNRQLLDAIRQAAAGLDTDQPVSVVCMGHTGLPMGPVELDQIGAAIADVFNAAEVRMSPDWVTAHAGALGGEAGVVIAAGTGTVCLGIAEDGRSSRVDGWGHLFGDRGSAFWLGRAGYERALRHMDGRQTAPDLYDAAVRHFGDDLRSATWDIYGTGTTVDDIAHFAPDVIEAASGGGEAARQLVAGAVVDLAETVAAAARGIDADGEFPVSCVGGVFSAGGAILEPLERQLRSRLPQARLREPRGDSLDGAALLARDVPPSFGRLLTVYEREK